jgi:hypothetical protein
MKTCANCKYFIRLCALHPDENGKPVFNEKGAVRVQPSFYGACDCDKNYTEERPKTNNHYCRGATDEACEHFCLKKEGEE